MLKIVSNYIQILLGFKITKIVWSYTGFGEEVLIGLKIVWLLIGTIYMIIAFPLIKEYLKLLIEVKKLEKENLKEK